MPLISICIPTYKNVEFLQRLLDSISIQTLKDYEVIVTDDSPDDSIKALVADYKSLKINYYKNSVALGTPANWNFAISKAKGEWIKIMHHDDWFASENSLESFKKSMTKNERIIKCSYNNVYKNGKSEIIKLTNRWKERILKQPMCLMANNVIGPPSVLLIHYSIKEIYDERLKWRVDQEFYIRLLKSQHNFQYIRDALINVGISEEQVTNSCFNNPFIELPEGLILLKKYGVKPLKNILVYDAWWRLLRNINITTQAQLNSFTNSKWPPVIINMVKHLKNTPKVFLKVGVLSKAFMAFSYLINLSYLNKNQNF